ncbi:hypothetical protein NFX46_39085 [Streptomyces phaeoluteigriseus]|uniref:Secreted protein n=1 Tax=Streptomyces phaeoluteigriseus TaxID=114686 RepID=A0ABY4ZLP2_9ACTN|nr:hypothetical protein [Streptomyces phaeoluteigriseus]USQ89217.1 hypothetical protein NFX46_39085 [Streptomyces phaeoluteigriseus]
MRRPTWTQGRRGAVLGASAAVVMCTAGLGLLAAGGGGPDGGHVATGAAPGLSGDTGAAAPPTAGVRLIPLDDGESESGSPPPGEAEPAPRAPQSGTPPASGPRPSSPGVRTSPAPPQAPDGPSKSPSPAPGSPPPPTPTATAPPAGPAVLDVSEPERAATDRRWCEQVTLTFHNSGGTAVRSGSVTLGTHVIGALGIDWATIESTENLPTPIAPGARERGTWTVCVDAWRVPLGMHVETRDVSVRWE